MRGRGRESERERGRERVRGRGRERIGRGRVRDSTSQYSRDVVLHTLSWATHSVIKRYSIDCHEVRKVVLVGVIVPVPCNHIKGRVELERR